MAETSDPSLPDPLPPPAQPPQPAKRVTLQPKGPQPIRPGSLFICRYAYWKHDPAPLVLVSALYKDGRIAGVNLHNLTLTDMKNLIMKHCNKAFNYAAIKGRKEITKGFRTYRSDGIQQARVLDCQYILNALGVVRQSRMMSPGEVEEIKKQVQQQIRQKINMGADEYRQQTQSATIPLKPASVPGIPVGQQGE